MDDDIAEIEATQEAMEEAITVADYQEEQIINVTPSYTTGAMGKDGTIFPTYTSFEYTQKISVREGDVVTAPKGDGTGNASLRWVCAFSGNSAVTASGADDDRTSYIVPSGIDGVVVSVRVANNVAKIVVDRIADLKSAYIKPTPMGYTMVQDSLSDGESLILPYENVKNYNCYIFNANITSFDKIIFSKNHSLEIDDTNIVITNDATSPTIPHGLTIADNISLMIENDTSTNTSLIRLSSDGQEFSYTTPVRFVMDSNSPTITSDGSTLTECTFSWVSKNVNAPIWMFGDSYFSWYEQRWTYYLARDGYTKSVMLNGFAGQSSNTAYTALVNLLNITVPKIVVWCIGMNDGDTDSAVSGGWKAVYDKLVELQKKYGFELILYTVPTTPVVQNDYKNAIIRASDYRYIECDKAVRIAGTRNWISGALDVDDVHPTTMGAKILYYRILADLPELLSNY